MMNARCIEELGGGRPNHYPLRLLARAFGYVAVATVIYVAALVAIAVESRLVEF
jgi:hypothetical protein